ncbi:hypothetical protein [Actinoplanes sp. TFC3]|nr:hypothetical protein [Actinoplanes sp. TFC3]
MLPVVGLGMHHELDTVVPGNNQPMAVHVITREQFLRAQALQ